MKTLAKIINTKNPSLLLYIENFRKDSHWYRMALFNINRFLLFTILLIAFAILHNNPEAEASAATSLTKNSIDPPFGNWYQ